MIKFTYLLCWLGIHRYRVVDTTFGFGAAGTTQRLQCRNCGIQKIKIKIYPPYGHVMVMFQSLGERVFKPFS